MTAPGPAAGEDVSSAAAAPDAEVPADVPADVPANGEFAALVRRALDGDDQAFGELIDRHERAALAVAYAATRDAASAADAVQEACLKAWHKRHTLEDPRRFGGWLLHIVRRCAIDQVRRARPAKPLALVAEVEVPALPCGAAERLARHEADQRVRQALDALDEESRLAVVMRYYDGAPAKQIAEVLGCSPAAVDMRLKRARDKLRTFLGDLDHDPDRDANADSRNAAFPTP